MDEKKIIFMYTDENKSTYEIAQLMNTYPNRVRRILIRNGVNLKTKSEAQKNAIQNGTAMHPTLGKERSYDEKLKISHGLKNYWNTMSQELYDKRIEQSKNRWENLSELDKHNMTSAAIKAIQLAGKEGSKLEKFVRNELEQAGYTVEFHKKNLIPNTNLEIDLYIPEVKAIIEIDGPSHFFPIWGEEKLQKQIKADFDKTGLVLNKGYIVIRVKNTSDSVSLATKEKLKSDVLTMLNDIKTSFPKKTERYIEIEI
jgi:very-short-patch-repair endonuclease